MKKELKWVIKKDKTLNKFDRKRIQKKDKLSIKKELRKLYK